MKETGIIMSGNHPRLILDELKTMTRRVIKPQPEKIPDDVVGSEGAEYWYPSKIHQTMIHLAGWQLAPMRDCCPYGQVGDRLWVRETWATEKRYDHLKPSDIPETAKIYFVDGAIHSAGGYSLFTEMGKVRSAMFMCRWMSRAEPVITEVRVERVQEISIQDVYAEGIAKPLRTDLDQPITQYEAIDRLKFERLWDSLNAKRGYGWDSNCWVWVISFKIL